MHTIEPYYSWRHYYIASEDELSPFFNRNYSEFEFSNAIYNHLIHPQWDFMGSSTLYIKILYSNYSLGFSIIELLGEWNDTLHNDIMHFKNDVVDVLVSNGITKFILIGENVLNFHSAEDDYYGEWADDIEDGWIVGINFREHVIQEFCSSNIDYYIAFGGLFDEIAWRNYNPVKLFEKIDGMLCKRLNP